MHPSWDITVRADGWTTRWVKSCCWMMGLTRNQLMGLLHLPVKMLQESVMGPVLLNIFINDLERQWSANSPGLQVTPNRSNPKSRAAIQRDLAWRNGLTLQYSTRINAKCCNPESKQAAVIQPGDRLTGWGGAGLSKRTWWMAN